MARRRCNHPLSAKQAERQRSLPGDARRATRGICECCGGDAGPTPRRDRRADLVGFGASLCGDCADSLALLSDEEFMRFAEGRR